MKQLLTRTKKNADRFRHSLDRAFDRSQPDGSREDDNINQFVKDFAETASHLSDHFDSRQVVTTDIEDVNASGRLSGRADMALNFESVRMRNGRTYQFAGVIENVRTANGATISVDNEGTVEVESQTEKTIQRSAIGAALGAIIGAISGGGTGAAIGAAIGAGGGAGTVIVQGRDQLDLPRGTELTITSSLSRSQRTSTSRQQ